MSFDLVLLRRFGEPSQRGDMVGRPRLSAREDHPELQLRDGVSLFRQWGEQRQCTSVVALGVGHQRVGQHVGRTLLYPVKRLDPVKRLGMRLERSRCSLAPGERGQQDPSVDVGDHFAPPCVAFRDIGLTFGNGAGSITPPVTERRTTCRGRHAPEVSRRPGGSGGIRDANSVPESAATLPSSEEIELSVGTATEWFMPRLQ
jgi:hypothetical protein